MNLREKGGSNLVVQRRNRREQSRFRPSRSYPLLSIPARASSRRCSRRWQAIAAIPAPSVDSLHPRQSKSIRKLSLPASQSIYTLKFAGFWPASGARRAAAVTRSRLGMAVASPLSVPGHDAFLDLHGVDLGFCQYCSGL